RARCLSRGCLGSIVLVWVLYWAQALVCAQITQSSGSPANAGVAVAGVRSPIAKSPDLFSLRPERLHRLNTCRAASGEQSGQERARAEHRNGCKEDQRVVSLYSKQQAGHEVADGEDQGNADQQSQPNLGKRPAQHQLKNVLAIGAQGHANADFSGASRYAISGDAVESYTSQRQSERAKPTAQARHQRVIAGLDLQLFGEAANIERREVGIDLFQDPLNLRRECVRVAGDMEFNAAHVPRCKFEPAIDWAVIVNNLRQRHKETRIHFVGSVDVFRILGYTHDLVIVGVAGLVFAEVLADRVLIREVLLRECLVDDCYFLRCSRVLLFDSPTAYDGIADGLEVTRAHTQPI